MKASIVSPHDKFFKAAMTDKRVAVEFFQAHLPPVVKAAADFQQLKLQPGSYVDEELQSQLSDLLFSVPFQEAPGYLYILVEHQSRPDRWMPLRLLKYTCAIWQQHLEQTGKKTLPLIYPLLFYHGKQPYPYSTDIKALIAAPSALIDSVWGQPFQLIDTQTLSDDELKTRYWSGVMEYLLKYQRLRDIVPLLTFIKPLLQQLDKVNARDYLSRIVYYMLAGKESSVEKHQVIDLLVQGLSKEVEKDVMTIAEQLRVEGRMEGRNEGFQAGILKGKTEGEATLLLRQLERKFKVIPSSYQERIAKASADDLLTWGERLIDAKTLSDIFGH